MHTLLHKVQMCLTTRQYVPDEKSEPRNSDELFELVDTCEYVGVDETNTGIDSNSLACIQWNIRGLISKQCELSKFLLECGGTKKIDLVILSETWLTRNNSNKVNVPGYSFVGNNRTSKKGGGVGFLISDTISYNVRKDLYISSNILENISIEFKLGKKYYIACSMYRPPNTNAKEFNDLFLDYLTKQCKLANKQELIIGLDHNLDFLNKDKHVPTQLFIEQILDNDLMPVITKPTRITKHSATLIDNVLLSKGLSIEERSCIIETDLSDHLPSLVVVPNVYNKKCEPLEIVTRDTTPSKLTELNRLINLNVRLPNINQSVNENFNVFHDQLLDCINEVCPEKVVTIPAKRVIREPWISKGLIKCSSRQLALYRAFLHDKSSQNESKYLNYRNTLKKVKRRCKIDHYHQKCSEFRQNTKKLWKIINQVKGKCQDKSTIITCLKIDNVKNYNSSNICDHLGKYFATVGENYASKIPNSEKNIKDYVVNIRSIEKSIYLRPCSETEIKRLIIQLPNKTSSGYDRISNKLLKCISNSIVKYLTPIFNQSITEGTFPDRMKHAEVIALYKQGDRCNVVNYRPISLLLTISKLLEKIMYSRTYEFLTQNESLYESQYGFRKKHSCEHAITELVGQIAKSLENKQYTIAVYLDLSKAFDTLSHHVLYEKLDKYGIRGVALSWYKSYLTNRTMQAKCNSGNNTDVLSSNFALNFGTPQSSCLGPLLFLIFCNDLIKILENCRGILFADDTTVYKSNKSLKYLIWNVNQDLNKISDWFRANQLTLNTSKTVCMLFSPKKTKEMVNLIVNNEHVKQVDYTKFLGVWIDTSLNWKIHVNRLSIKLKQGQGMLRQCKSLLDFSTKKILYYAQCFSHLNYCISVWGCMLAKSDLKKLQLLQDGCVKQLINRSPTTVDYRKLELLTVEQIILLEKHKFAYKTLSKQLPTPLCRVAFTDQNGLSLKKPHSYNTRHKQLPRVVKSTNDKYRKSIIHSAFTHFHELPKSIRDAKNITEFVNLCKKYIFAPTS